MSRQKKMKVQKTSIIKETLSRIWDNPGSRVGIILILAIIVLCVFAPLFAPYGVNDMDLVNMCKFRSNGMPIPLTAA